MADARTPKDGWDKLESVAKVAAAALVPIAIAAAGWMVERAVKQQELSVRYIEMAIAILSEESDGAASGSLRDWASSILAQYSPVSMPAEVRADLKARRLPDRVYEGVVRPGISPSASIATQADVAEALRNRSDLRDFAIEELRRIRPEEFKPVRGQ